jgi:cytochrome c5
MKKSFILIAVIGLAVACNTAKKATTTETTAVPTDIERGQKLYPGYTLAELNEGKSLYDAKCSTCHDLVKVTHESPEAWKKIVPKMSELSNKEGKTISPKEENLILKYLVTMSSK